MRKAPLVELLYFDDCPNWRLADRRLRDVAGRLGLDVIRTSISTAAEAAAANFRGSPTILIDGVDPFADDTEPVGLSCRRYMTTDGFAGAPTIEQIEAALALPR